MSQWSERVPSGNGWSRIHNPLSPQGAVCSSAWERGRVRVISSLVYAEYPKGEGSGMQWLVTISRVPGRRPKPHDIRRALRAFGAESFEDDAHHPGIARHFWLPVDPAERVRCQCKADEEVVTETDGYKWTNPKGATIDECRGCEWTALSGLPCPIHVEGKS